MKTITSSDVHGTTYEVPLDQLVWRPASYGVVIEQGNILLTKMWGTYHLPGGATNLGETPEDGAIREIREETGLTVTNPHLIGSLSGFYSFEYPKGAPMNHAQSLLLYYTVDLVGGELTTDGFVESEKEYGEMAEWIPLKELDSIAAGGTIDWRSVVKNYLFGLRLTVGTNLV